MADPKITAHRGWSQLESALGRKMPGRLHESQKARLALMNLTRGKKRG